MRYFRKPSGRIVAFVVAFAALLSAFVVFGLRERSLLIQQSPYPKTQNGLTFVAQHKNNSLKPLSPWENFKNFASGYAPFLFAPVYQWYFPSMEIAVPLTTSHSTFSASAKTPTGEAFDLGSTTSAFANVSSDHLLVTLPDVPANYPFLDVTLDDKKGHRGTGRVYDLPRLKRALPVSAPLCEAQTVQKVNLSARAWWKAGAAPKVPTRLFLPSFSLPVVFEIKATSAQPLASPSEQWGVQINQITHQWELPPPLSPAVAQGSVQYSETARGTNGAYTKALTAITPHPSDQHIAQIKATLSRYDRTGETVTFRNVPLEADLSGLSVKSQSGVSRTTPSGVRVTLLSPYTSRSALAFESSPGANDVTFGVKVSPETGNLPASPLQKRVGKTPLHLSWQVPYNSRALSDMTTDPNTVRMRFQKRLPSPVLPELVVNITQEAELQKIPVVFTVPVKAGKPTERWGY